MAALARRYPQWKAIGPWGGSARVVRLDAAKPETLLALTMRGAGVFRSGNGGASWQESDAFPALEGARLDCAAIAAGQWLVGAAPGGLWTSRDEGARWSVAPGTEKLSIYALTVWAKDPRVMAAGTNQGVWLSHDGARTWRRGSPAAIPDLAAIVSVAFDPAKAGTLYAGTPHLPWKTTDGGVTWRKAHLGMYDDSDIFSIAVDPSMPGRVFASACSGIYCSLNGGAAWRRAQGIPGTNRRTYVVAQDPHEGKRVLAGTSAGMWRSLDAGTTWSKLNAYVATSLAFHPERAGLIYASTERHGILWTRDGGETFEPRHEGFVSRSVSGVRDDGKSWTAMGELEDNGEQLPGPDKAFEVRRDPFTSEHWLAATPRGLERSHDEGRTWQAVEGGLGPGWIRSVAFNPKQRGYVYALRGQRVFWSRDAGRSWYWLPAEEGIKTRFRRLEIAASQSSQLLVISEDRGLFSYDLDQNPLD